MASRIPWVASQMYSHRAQSWLRLPAFHLRQGGGGNVGHSWVKTCCTIAAQINLVLHSLRIVSQRRSRITKRMSARNNKSSWNGRLVVAHRELFPGPVIWIVLNCMVIFVISLVSAGTKWLQTNRKKWWRSAWFLFCVPFVMLRVLFWCLQARPLNR